MQKRRSKFGIFASLKLSFFLTLNNLKIKF